MGRQDWMNAPPGSKVYVGRDLPADVTTDDLKRLFDKYGPIRAVWAARSPPGFAYVTFDDPRDAKDACRALDGIEYRGTQLCVEVARGPRPGRPYDHRSSSDQRYRGYNRGRSFSRERGRYRSPSRGRGNEQRSPYRGGRGEGDRNSRRFPENEGHFCRNRNGDEYNRGLRNPNDIPIRNTREDRDSYEGINGNDERCQRGNSMSHGRSRSPVRRRRGSIDNDQSLEGANRSGNRSHQKQESNSNENGVQLGESDARFEKARSPNASSRRERSRSFDDN